MAQIHLEVVTPNGAVVSEDVDIVTAPGVGGEFGVLANQRVHGLLRRRGVGLQRDVGIRRRGRSAARCRGAAALGGADLS